MRSYRSFSIFRGFARGASAGGESATTPSGSALEQAYRELLLENQVLTESNQRLHERLARAEDGLEESPAARQLIRAQRAAITERTHKLRELQYANTELQRQQRKVLEQNRRLQENLAGQTAEAGQLEARDREISALQQQLVEKRRELAMLTDRYYQLQSRIDPALSADRVINADF
jgi:predicted RNase H-like nuclease (RuvC/YqgF family)